MHRKRLTMVLVTFAVSAVGLSIAIATASGQVKARSAVKTAKVTTITVTAGKPSEFAFKLSKTGSIPVGKVTFKVTNAGVIGHSFKICTKAVTASTANTCVGTATKVLNKGQTATVTVTLAKGAFEFLCTVSGHAANGMKGIIAVGETLAVATKGATTAGGTTGGATTTAGGTTAAKGACASPATTTISVNMVDYSFTGVPSSLPCGTVTVTEVNAGQQDHNISFNGSGVTGGIGPVIGPGANASFTMTINPGTYAYQCDVGDHAAQGMVGSVTVH
jgi:plastocyanin